MGYGKFILGETLTNYNVQYIDGGSYSKNNEEFKIYSYPPSSNETIEILNIKFDKIILTFNDSNKLVSLHFIRFYQKKDTKKYVKESKIGYDKLVAYASKQLNKKGETKKKKKKSNIQDYGQEWNETTTLLLSFIVLILDIKCKIERSIYAVKYESSVKLKKMY